jgi:hypothetical protein
VSWSAISTWFVQWFSEVWCHSFRWPRELALGRAFPSLSKGVWVTCGPWEQCEERLVRGTCPKCTNSAPVRTGVQYSRCRVRDPERFAKKLKWRSWWINTWGWWVWLSPCPRTVPGVEVA